MVDVAAKFSKFSVNGSVINGTHGVVTVTMACTSPVEQPGSTRKLYSDMGTRLVNV